MTQKHPGTDPDPNEEVRAHHRTEDPQLESAVRRAADRAVLESIPPISVALAVLYLVFTVAHWFVLPPGIAPAMMTLAGGSALLFLGLWGALGRWTVPPRYAHPLAAAVAAVVLVNSLAHLFLTLEARQTTNLLLLVLGVGILFLDAGWFSLVVAATLGGWFLVVHTATPSGEWIHFGFALLGSGILAAAVLVIRIRSFRTMQRLHFQERMRQLELETALATTERARQGEADARRALEGAISRLREGETRFRRLAEATLEGVLVVQGGVVVDANRRAAELFGLAPSELRHRKVETLVADEDRELLRRLLAEGSSQGPEGPLPAEIRGRTGSDDEDFPMEVTVIEARFQDEPARVAVFRDITMQKRVETALKQAAAEAEASSQAKSNFLANMSHELRTPLNAVIGFANILEKKAGDALGEREQDYLERILSNGKHLLALINDILDLSRIEAGRMEIETSPVELGPLLDEVVQVLEQQAARKGLELRARVPGRLKPVEADRQRLKQVLLNLAGNAVKFTSRGKVVLRVGVSPEDPRLPVALEVEDTGIGIPAERLESIFSPFQQVEGSTSRRYGGTGLGLTISRSLCALMGFKLEAESREGEGSTFRVVLDPLNPGWGAVAGVGAGRSS